MMMDSTRWPEPQAMDFVMRELVSSLSQAAVTREEQQQILEDTVCIERFCWSFARYAFDLGIQVGAMHVNEGDRLAMEECHTKVFLLLRRLKEEMQTCYHSFGPVRSGSVADAFVHTCEIAFGLGVSSGESFAIAHTPIQFHSLCEETTPNNSIIC